MAVLVLLDNGLRNFQVPTYRCVRQLKSAKVTASINMLSNYFEIIPENCHKRYVKNIKKNGLDPHSIGQRPAGDGRGLRHNKIAADMNSDL